MNRKEIVFESPNAYYIVNEQTEYNLMFNVHTLYLFIQIHPDGCTLALLQTDTTSIEMTEYLIHSKSLGTFAKSLGTFRCNGTEYDSV